MEWRERGLVEAGGEGGWKERGEDFRAGRGERRDRLYYYCISSNIPSLSGILYILHYTYMHINRYRAVCFIDIQCCCVQGRSEFRCIDLTLHALESQSSSSLKGGLGQVRITLQQGNHSIFLGMEQVVGTGLGLWREIRPTRWLKYVVA